MTEEEKKKLKLKAEQEKLNKLLAKDKMTPWQKAKEALKEKAQATVDESLSKKGPQIFIKGDVEPIDEVSLKPKTNKQQIDKLTEQLEGWKTSTKVSKELKERVIKKLEEDITRLKEAERNKVVALKPKVANPSIEQVGGPAPIKLDPRDQEMIDEMWKLADDGIDMELDDHVRKGPKPGSVEWVNRVNTDVGDTRTRFYSQGEEGFFETHKSLRRRYKQGVEEHGALTKIWHGEAALRDFIKGEGIKKPGDVHFAARHTSVEPIGLYTVDRSGLRYLPDLMYGTGKEEGTITSFGKLRKFLSLSGVEEGDIVSRIAMDPNAKILDVGNPIHWLGYLDDFGRGLEASGDIDEQRKAGKVLQQAVRNYVEGNGRSLHESFWNIAKKVEQELGGDAGQRFYEYVASHMSTDLTNHLRKSYDAVKFPDVVIEGQQHMPQVVVLNKGKAVMRVGKAFMPLSVAFAAGMALMPEQASASPLDAQMREKELKEKFKISEAADLNATFQASFRTPKEEEALQSLTVTRSSESGDWEKASKAMPLAAITSANSFVQGALPLDVIPQVKSVYDAMDNGVAKLAEAAGVPKDQMAATIGGTTGMFYGIGKMFKYGQAGRAWLAGRMLPQSIPGVGRMTSMTGKAPFGEKALALGSNALLAAAIGVGYDFGKGEIKTAKQAAATGGIWGGTDLLLGGAGMAAPYLLAGSMATKNWLGNAAVRAKAFEGICKATNTVLEKIPMQWAFNGKYGPTLLHYFQPPSKRLPKIEGGGQESLEDIRTLLQNMVTTEERIGNRVVESAKALKDIPEGRRLVHYLMKMNPSKPEFWEVMNRIKNKHGEKAANELLTQRALSRKDWIEVGREGTKAPYKTVDIPGPRVWVPKPEAVRSFAPAAPLEEGQSFFTGFYNDDTGKYVLKFVQRKAGSEAIEDKMISSAREFKLLAKTSTIVNKADLKASGRWKKSFTQKDIPLLKEETFLKNFDTYVPRVITKFWEDLPADVQAYYQKYQTAPDMPHKKEAARMMGASINRFMKKHNLPEELVNALEPITDQCVLDYQELRRTWNAIHTSRTFDSISRRPGVCMDQAMFTKAKDQPGFKLVDWVKVPNIPDRYLKLAGKYLHRDVAEELETLVLPSLESSGMFNRAFIKWKGWKTIWNPKQHVRNPVSNVILNATVGKYSMPPWGRGFTCYKDMAKVLYRPDLPEHKALLDEMRSNNLFIGSFKHSDLAHIKPVMDEKVENVFDMLWVPTKSLYNKAEGKLGRAYEAEERWAKGAKYLYLTRHRGVDPKVAAEEAMESTFNYGDIPLFIKDLRSKWWGSPFATFTYKTIPAMVESAVKYPWRIGAIEGAIYGFNMAAYNALGLNEQEQEQIKRELPEYMSGGRYAPLPIRDDKGRIQWFDATFLLPWGIYYTMNEAIGGKPGTSGVTNLVKLLWNNPIAATVSGIWANQKFNGQPIVQSFDDGMTAVGRQLAYVWEQAVPSLMIGGTDFKSILDTIGYPEWEKSLSWPQQISRQVGIGVRPMSEQQIRRQYMARTNERIKDIRSDLKKKIQKNPKNQDKEIKKAQERLRSLLSE